LVAVLLEAGVDRDADAGDRLLDLVEELEAD
jgi:hypothetical protein